MAKEVVRFDGYIDALPVAWTVVEDARTEVTAQDRLSRFTRLRTLRDPMIEELGDAQSAPRGFTLDVDSLDGGQQLAGGVTWLYGLQESSGSTVAGDVSGIPGRPRLTLTQSGSDGTAEFGTAGTMPEGTAITFTPASAGNGLTLGSSSLITYTGGEFSLWCQFEWHATSSAATLVQIGTSPGGTVTLGLTSTTVTATFTPSEGTAATATKTITTNNRRPHFALVTCTAAGDISLYVDLESAATATRPSGMGSVQGLTIGHTVSAAAVQVAWVGHSSVHTSADRAADLARLATGASMRSDLVVARVLGWLGLAGDLIAETGLSDVAYVACGGRSALEVIADVSAVENGLFFVGGDGRFRFHSRSHRYNQPVRVDIDVSDVDPTAFAVVVDPIRVVNDLTVSRPSGATYRAENRASIEANTRRTGSPVTLYAASDADLQAAAEWHVGRMGQLAPHVAQVRLDLLVMPDDTVGPLMGLEIGDRITISGLPPQAPAATLDLFVEGITDEISDRSWWLTLATSPAIWHTVGELDSAEYGQLDSTAIVAY